MIENEKIKKENNYKMEISLKLSNYKYSPSEEIEGELIIHPSKEIKLSNILDTSEFYIIFEEKIAYQYFVNSSKTFILDKKILKHKNNKDLDNRKTFKIPIKYKLPDANTKNFHPTFRYFSESVKCIISHSISIELPFISNKSSVNIFIKKFPLEGKINKNELDKIYFGDELIKKYFFFKAGIFSYYIKTKKSITYKEKYPVEIHIDEGELGDIKLDSILINIKKQIYFYNEVNIFTDTLEEIYDSKKLIFNKYQNRINNTIIESLKLPKNEFTPLSLLDIQKINLSKTNINFTPPVDNILFKCNYYLEINFCFNDKLIQDIIINLPIDYYDSEYNINESDKETNEIDDINENKINNKFNQILNKEKNYKITNENNNKNKTYNGFIEITKEDLMKVIDGIKEKNE